MLAGTVFVQSSGFSRGFDLREEIRKVSQRPRLIDDPDYFLTSLSLAIGDRDLRCSSQNGSRQIFRG